ncbi:holocarboxylase synthetase [Senna tora]|uniref:Holocarboxylase synthetase n=1 Tax=Senna tora TaxID=362788 RepID=A0A834WXL8_9FABA|nr:holocarboxylase synthetase [Senna tora]
MAKKRKSVATRLDEVDRTMYSTFCSAANSLSQLYTQAMNQQKLSFQAGERHALEKLYQWILRQQQEGSRVATIDIVTYLQNEIEYGAEESPVSPRQPFHQQHSQNAMHANNVSAPVPSNAFTAAVIGQGIRSGQPDQQPKNSVFSNALSSPIRRSLQPYQLAQGGSLSSNVMSSGNGTRNCEIGYSNGQNRDTNSSNSTDSMDMHADSPDHDFSY